jgi:hypothetical protein
MTAEAKAGKISRETDQTKALLEAVRMVDRSRREGKPLALLVGQKDIFSGTSIDVITEAFLRLMYRDDANWRQPVSRKSLSEALRFYVDEARKTQEGTDLLGEGPAKSGDILKTSKRKQGDDTGQEDANQETLELVKPKRAESASQAVGEGAGKAGGDGKGTDLGVKEEEARSDAGGKGEVVPVVKKGEVVFSPSTFKLSAPPKAGDYSSLNDQDLTIALGVEPRKYLQTIIENARSDKDARTLVRAFSNMVDPYRVALEDGETAEADKMLAFANLWLMDSKKALEDEASGSEKPNTSVSDQASGAKPDKKPSVTEDIKKTAYGASNTLVKADRAAELRAKLKAKLSGSQINAGIDPEILAMGAELATFHIEAGVRKFADFAKAVSDDIGLSMEKLKPYLRSWYNGARDMLEDNDLDINGMDDADTVKSELARMFTKAPSDVVTDPLSGQGKWRDASIVVTLDDGSKEKMNAGQAVDLMKSRIKAVSQLLECVRAA